MKRRTRKETAWHSPAARAKAKETRARNRKAKLHARAATIALGRASSDFARMAVEHGLRQKLADSITPADQERAKRVLKSGLWNQAQEAPVLDLDTLSCAPQPPTPNGGLRIKISFDDRSIELSVSEARQLFVELRRAFPGFEALR